MKTNQEIAYERIVEIINLVDCGKLTDSQGIKRVMKTITKQHQNDNWASAKVSDRFCEEELKSLKGAGK